MNQAEAAAAATAFFPRGFLAGLAFFSFCEASKADVRARAACKKGSMKASAEVTYEIGKNE